MIIGGLDLLTESFLELGINCNILINNDAYISLVGAHGKDEGIILISGTGSIALGINKNKDVFRVGGWGHILGDEGSGFAIGKKGLIAIAKEYDGRSIETKLTKVVEAKYGISNSDILINKVYAENFDIASIATDVIECANNGDQVCQQILREEATELFWHVVSALKKLRLKELTLSLIGSLITNENFYSNAFKEMVIKNLPQVTIAEPIYNPAIGAILMAKSL